MAMRHSPPSLDQLQLIAERYGIELTADEAKAYRDLMAGTLESYAAVDAIEQARPAREVRRAVSRPSAAENPLGAWYVRTSIPGRADGPLAGRTVAIKDNTFVAGVPMMNGSATLEGFVPGEDATVVSRLIDAGAEIVGKAVCEDLCFSGASHTSFSGPVRNPWNPRRTAGGSSSGSAALLAAGEVDLALGGDQGGSIRIPASFCGIVGLKPTHGLVPYTGAFPIEATIDHLGPMARTVRDTAEMLQAIAGPDTKDPRHDAAQTTDDYLTGLEGGVEGLRIGVLAEGFGWAGLSSAAVDDTVRAAAQRFGEIGADILDISVPMHLNGIDIWNVIAVEGATTQMLDLNGMGMNWKGRYSPELVDHYRVGRRNHANELSPTVKLVALLGSHMIETHGGAYYARAQNLAPSLTAAYDAALAEVDVIALPTVPITATRIPTADAPIVESVARALEMVPNTAPFNVTGHPAISIPAGLVDGLPVGLMLVGRHHEEAKLLATARAFERLVGGFPTPSRLAVEA
jgi:amidase